METITMQQFIEKLKALGEGYTDYFGYKTREGIIGVIRVDRMKRLDRDLWLVSWNEGSFVLQETDFNQMTFDFQIRDWFESLEIEEVVWRKVYRGARAQELCSYFTDRLTDPEWAERPMWFKDDMDEAVCGIWHEDGKWVCNDNSSGDNWVEEFDREQDALDYLFYYNNADKSEA